MRRILAILLTVGVFLTGCGMTPVAGMANLEGNQTAEDAPLPAAPFEYQLSMKTFRDVAHAESGEALASYRVSIPEMTVFREDGEKLEEPRTVTEKRAAELAEAFNQEFASWSSGEEFEQAAEDAQKSLELWKEEGLDWFEGYSLELDCSVYQTDTLISVYGSCTSYTGGAHPNTILLGWNFDMETGTFFDGKMLSADGPNLQKQVGEELIRQTDLITGMDGMTAAELFWPEYETLLMDWTNYTVFFNEKGMNVAFSPYELAPYAAGEQMFLLSYEWLESRLGQHSCRLLGLEYQG